MIKNMEIDISSATALDKDGFPRYKSDDNVDIKTFMPRGSLVSKRLYQGDELTRSLSESKEFKVDVLGQIGAGISSAFLNFTAKTVANLGDLMVQVNQRKTQRQADFIKKKRENPKYNPRLDIARLSDDFALAYAEREKPIEIDTKEGKQIFKQNNVFENINNGVNKYISENLAMKKGLANEMAYRMASGGASIAFSYVVGGILRAMKAATVIQAGTPAAWIGLVSGGGAAEEAKDKGFDLDKQLKVFKEVGVSETAIEFMGMDAILRGMRGARPISRIALDTFNNMSQEFLQGFSEGAILKNEGIRQETWGSILTDATKDFFSAMIPSGAASSAHYYYQNKSLIGDFRQAGLSDNDADVVLDEVMKLKDDSTVDDFLNGLEQKGLPKDLAKKATKVIEDYNGRIAIRDMLKDSPLTQIIMKLRSKGVKSANALLAAEKILGEEVPKAIQREMINLIDKQMADYNKLEAEEQVKYAFMKKYVELGKYGKFLKATDEEWLQSGIALADVAAAQAIKQAEFEGWQKGLNVKEQNDLNALEFKRKSEEVLTPEELKKRDELLKKKAKEGARTPIQVFEGLNIDLRKKDKGKGDLFQEGDVKNDAEDFIKKNPNATAEEFVASKGKELFRGDANPITIELYDVSQGIKEGKELGGAMAEGPGVYLTTDKNNALSYGKNITNVVMDKDSNILEKGQKKLSISKINKLLTSIDKETLDIALSSFDENPIIAKRNLIDAINNADDAQEQIINIWADVFYHQKPEKFMKVMADNGIDGLKIDKEKLSHYVIYNKKSLIDKSQLLSEFEKAKKQKELFQGDVKNVLFQSKDFPRASIDFSSEEGKRIITMFENADASSMLHELGHVWFKDMFDYVKSGKADANYLEHYQAVKEYLGLDDNQSELTVEQQETFARSLESFFMEGNAPIGNAKLQGAFSAFREWLKRVYIDKQSLNVELSDDIRDFFARMFGGYRAMTQEDVLTIEPISINELAVIADEEDIGRMKVDIETLKEKIKFYKKFRDYFRGRDKKGLLNIDEYELYYKGEFQDLSLLKEYFRKEGGRSLDDVAQSFFELYPEMKRYSEDVSETDEIIEIMKQVLTHDFSFSEERNQIAFLEEIIKASEGKEVVGDFRDISIEEAEKIFKDKAEKIYSDNLIRTKTIPIEQRYSITLRQWMKDRQTASKRGYKSGVKETKAKFNAILKELKTTGKINRKNIIDLIKGLDLEAKDKAKFLSSVGRVDTAEKMADEVRDIERRYSAYYESAQKNAIEEEIANELSTTKPVKEGRLTKGRYDYERNKLFETLRAYSKMTKDEAREALSLIDFTEDRIVPEEELITRRLLSLKANGKESSLELFEQVLSDIGRIKIHGRLAKNEADFIKRVERREFLEKIMPVLEAKKNDAEAVKTQILGFYLRGFSNTYSMLNALFNKETALALDPEPLEIDAKTAMYYTDKKIVNDALKIFGIEKTNDLHNLFMKMSSEKFEIEDFQGIKESIDRMQIIDIYNSIKNEKIRERYSRYLGMEQVQSLVDNLTSKEKEFADYLQTTIQSYYDVLNNKSIALTGRDLGRIENYWPATSEKPVDIYEDFTQQSNIPSALKARGGTLVIPRPVNAWHKAQKHVVQALHTQYLSNRFEELRRIFLDRKITKIIQSKFGEDVHAVMMNKINDLSLNKQLDRLDEITKVFQKALNNWVVAKVSLNPSIFFKQLVSTGNYMEDMPVKEWIKYFAQGISSPKETFDFMWNNAPFLEARFNTGYEEALSRAMSGSKEILKLSHDWAQGLTSLVRSGDITAIIMGGYPIVKYEMEVNNKSLDEAMEIFKNQTYKAQQSPMLSGMSEWQKNKNPFARLFLVFRNTSNQYLRKQVDAIVSYNNGDIDKVQLGKILTIYGVIQPTLWVAMGYAISNSISLLSKIMSGGGDDDKEKNIIEDIFNEIVLSPFKSLAIVESLVQLAIRRAQKKPQWKIYSLPLLDDIADSISKAGKKNISFWDYLDIAAGIIEPAKGLPIKTWSRYGKKIIGDGKKTKKRKVRRLIKKRTKMKSQKRMVKKR